MSYPNTLSKTPLLLETIDLGERANRAVFQLKQHNLIPVAGLAEEILPDVQSISREPKVVEYCPNDINRFGSIALANKWIGKEGGRGFVGIARPDMARWLRLLAYGWTGFEENKHIVGADTTSAYRSGEEGGAFARELRANVDPNFSMGFFIGEIVLGTAVYLFGAKPDKISLETWGSNAPARNLYDALGFVQLPDVPNQPGERPTLKPIGTKINGNIVHVNPINATEHLVDDERCYYVLRGYTG